MAFFLSIAGWACFVNSSFIHFVESVAGRYEVETLKRS